MKDKLYLDREVCANTGEPQKVVVKVTREFLQALTIRIAKTGEVHLPGFGTFRVVVKKGKRTRLLAGDVPKERDHDRQLMVSFRKSATLRKLVRLCQGVVMEKYAVDEEVDQEDLEKKASEGCPKCGRQPEKHGRTLICSKHGTEPFEPSR